MDTTFNTQETAQATALAKVPNGTIKEGEILVTNSTDPGWTPVFMVISGIVLETGGMLAHGSCLAREYALPAVQIENAMQLIPDGAFVTINGDKGDLRVH